MIIFSIITFCCFVFPVIYRIGYDGFFINPANQIRKVFLNLETSSKDVNNITQNLDDYLNEIKTGKGALNHITQDETFVKELDSTMLQIKEASEKLNQNMEALQHNFFFRGYFRKLEKQKQKEEKEK